MGGEEWGEEMRGREGWEGKRERVRRGEGGDEEDGRVRHPNENPAYATALKYASYNIV